LNGLLNEFVHPNPAISDFIKGAGFFSDVPAGQKTGEKETGLFGKTRFPNGIAWFGSD